LSHRFLEPSFLSAAVWLGRRVMTSSRRVAGDLSRKLLPEIRLSGGNAAHGLLEDAPSAQSTSILNSSRGAF
jgi:hypothetical protein